MKKQLLIICSLLFSLNLFSQTLNYTNFAQSEFSQVLKCLPSNQDIRDALGNIGVEIKTIDDKTTFTILDFKSNIILSEHNKCYVSKEDEIKINFVCLDVEAKIINITLFKKNLNMDFTNNEIFFTVNFECTTI